MLLILIDLVQKSVFSKLKNIILQVSLHMEDKEQLCGIYSSLTPLRVFWSRARIFGLV